MQLDEKSTIHFQWNLDDESWWKVHNSFSMKIGWRILMKSPLFIFDGMWMANRIQWKINQTIQLNELWMEKSWMNGGIIAEAPP
jgi:hypothetical protein